MSKTKYLLPANYKSKNNGNDNRNSPLICRFYRKGKSYLFCYLSIQCIVCQMSVATSAEIERLNCNICNIDSFEIK